MCGGESNHIARSIRNTHELVTSRRVLVSIRENRLNVDRFAKTVLEHPCPLAGGTTLSRR
ncbi:protein of unknown function [Agreia sp. COWG]|nr:protein of unknown function [Agreia sp. COWG]